MSKLVTALDLRQRVCSVAQAEQGSRDSLKYWSEVLPSTWRGPPPPHWCGAFALWDLHVTLGCPWTWEIAGITNRDKRAGFLFRLPRTKNPLPGDICYQAAPYQHHAVLLEMRGRLVISQDGNTGPSPGVCSRKERDRSQWTAFYSIGPLLAKCLETTEIPERTLRRGDRGGDVAKLQRALGLLDDGVFGPATESAVRNLQQIAGLAVDGVFGQMTRKALTEITR